MNESDLSYLMEKMRSYCAWRERSEQEIRKKLKKWNINEEEAKEVILRLKNEDYLNEQRFLISFTGSHFRLKKWGKIKISHALKNHNIKEELIENALNDVIDEENYYESMKKLTIKKYASLSHKDAYSRKALTLRYMYQKGFEPGEVEKIIQEIIQE
jgi:regulatory protein